MLKIIMDNMKFVAKSGQLFKYIPGIKSQIHQETYTLKEIQKNPQSRSTEDKTISVKSHVERLGWRMAYDIINGMECKLIHLIVDYGN